MRLHGWIEVRVVGAEPDSDAATARAGAVPSAYATEL